MKKISLICMSGLLLIGYVFANPSANTELNHVVSQEKEKNVVKGTEPDEFTGAKVVGMKLRKTKGSGNNEETIDLEGMKKLIINCPVSPRYGCLVS